MYCTLALLANCLSLSGFYIEAGLSVADGGVQIERIDRTVTMTIPRKGFAYTSETYRRSIDHTALNPYGDLRIGYEVRFSTRVSGGIEAWHESSLSSRFDRGVNAGRLFVHINPFAR